ncbi:hypothetical protein [Aquipuribacter nitratireducens]|uniref:Uncharacterized protein n=1 Tax=Aquipuribacter nitratireducens TaxID=650104 RepID=A0ABW0GSG4_9MICO
MSAADDGPEVPVDVYVPLQEASRAYRASVASLRARARSGRLRAYKVPGPHGREWRVSLRSLASLGVLPRVPAQAGDSEGRVARLEAEVLELRARLAAERRRADRADQELGYALLQLGRLRSAEAAAGDRTLTGHASSGPA